MACICFFVALTIYIALIVTVYGYRINIRMDADNLSLCLRVYVFEWIEVFSFNIFEIDGKFAYAVNKSEYKTLKRKGAKKSAEEEKSDDEKPKADYAGFAANVLKDFPTLTIRKAELRYALNGDEMQNALINGIIYVTATNLKNVLYKRVKIKELSLYDMTQYNFIDGAEIEIVTGFSMFKIVLYLMHIITLKRKYTSVKYA